VSAKGIGRTWRTSDKSRKSVDYFKLEEGDDGKICFKTKESGTSCYIADGIKLTSDSDENLTGTVK